MSEGFAVWVTGPEPGRLEAVAGALAQHLLARELPVEVLDHHTPGIEGLDAGGIAFAAAALARHGVASVIALPATRGARDRARAQVGRFIEVHVHGGDDELAEGYEPPERAEVELVVGENAPGPSVARVLGTLEVLGLLAPEAGRGYSEAEERAVIRRLKAFGYL